MPIQVAGILNVTTDSFSDGGKFLDSSSAIEQADRLIQSGAHIIDIGAQSSNPDAGQVPVDEEINRMKPVIDAIRNRHPEIQISIDTFKTPVQQFAIAQDADFINDIRGFADPNFYAELADSDCKCIVMHMVQAGEKADRREVSPDEIYSRVVRFFDSRLTALTYAGVDRKRFILDPGMGFFLGKNPQSSYEILRKIPDLKKEFGLPVMISVSRKSFLAGPANKPPGERIIATAIAEALAYQAGADFIRTHDPVATLDAVRVIDEWHRHI